MTTRRYKFKIQGLEESNGEIKASDLQRVLSALIKTAERTTRLLATGEGVAQGAKPLWLEHSVDFTINGLSPGSTILEIESPMLLDTAHDQFSQQEFWRESPQETDTALDLAAMAITELLSEESNGERYDTSVIDAILELKQVARGSNLVFELSSGNSDRGIFKISTPDFEIISERKRLLPEPRAFIVSGKLDEIKYSAGRFRLFLANGGKLLGRVHPEFLTGEILRPLWGEEVTVEGMVHFKANGQPRLIDARKLTPKQTGDDIFDQLPSVSTTQATLFPEIQNRTKITDPMVLWGAWPGDESIEDLMAQLD